MLPRKSKLNSDLHVCTQQCKIFFEFSMKIYLYFPPSPPPEIEAKASETPLPHFSAEPEIPRNQLPWDQLHLRPTSPSSLALLLLPKGSSTPISCLALPSPLGSVFNCKKIFPSPDELLGGSCPLPAPRSAREQRWQEDQGPPSTARGRPGPPLGLGACGGCETAP